MGYVDFGNFHACWARAKHVSHNRAPIYDDGWGLGTHKGWVALCLQGVGAKYVMLQQSL